MTLLTPLALVAGLIIPVIIILYMLKKRTRPQMVSSIMLWQRLERINTPALRLSKLLRSLLLALQILTAAVLVLALARPVVNLLAGTGQNTIAIIDTSMAMAVTEDGDTRLEKALTQVRNMVQAKPPGDRMALVVMGEEARVLSGFSADGSALLRALDQVQINSARANPGQALALAGNMARAEEEAQVLLFSSGSFGQLSHSPDFPLDYIALGGQEVENLLVEDVVAHGERLYVTVYNNGTVPSTASVEINDDAGKVVGRREVQLEPDRRQTLVWRNLPDSRWYQAEIVNPGDQLALDNSFFTLAATASSHRLLLVSEGNVFLERALLLYPELAVSRVAPEAYTPGMAEMYDAYVFDGFLPQELPAAPVLVFDPPHPNSHFGTGPPVTVSNLQPSPHPLLSHTDFSEVSIGFAKTLVGGDIILQSDQGPLATEFKQQAQPLLAFGFALQAGDLPLRPAFPILLRNILDSFGGDGGDLPLDYAQPVPGGDWTVTSLDRDQELDPGTMLEAGIYSIESPGQEQTGSINPPAYTGSLVVQDQLDSPGGLVQGDAQARGDRLLLWPLLLTALVLVGLEWGVDNYGH